MYADRLTSNALSLVRRVVDDETAPPIVRADLADWLDRHAVVAQLHEEAKAAGTKARDDLAVAKRQAPHKVLTAIAGRGHERLSAPVAGDLAPLRQKLDRAEDHYAILSAARDLAERRLSSGILTDHRAVLLPWCIARRTDLPWWDDPAPEVIHVAEVIGRRLYVDLPRAAWITEGTAMVPAGIPFVVSVGKAATARLDHVTFMWHAIAGGEYEMTRGRLRVTADWDSRPPTPPRPRR